MIIEREIQLTVSHVAGRLGLSPAVVRRWCQWTYEGTADVPGVTWHQYPGTTQGYYAMTERSVEWLRKNVKPRSR